MDNRSGYVSRVHQAIRFAERAHRGQKRKGTEVSYIIHPMEVLQILTSMGAGEELQMAGVLHDTVEDTPVTLEQLREEFGHRVAQLVENHSEDKSRSWIQRKQHTIDVVKQADRETRLLVLADRVSNLRSSLADCRELGEAFWDRFNAPRALQLEYNRGLLEALSELRLDPAAGEVYREMEELCRDLFRESEEPGSGWLP